MDEDGQAAPQLTKKKPEGDLSEYNLDDYDEDEEHETGTSVRVTTARIRSSYASRPI